MSTNSGNLFLLHGKTYIVPQNNLKRPYTRLEKGLHRRLMNRLKTLEQNNLIDMDDQPDRFPAFWQPLQFL